MLCNIQYPTEVLAVLAINVRSLDSLGNQNNAKYIHTHVYTHLFFCKEEINIHKMLNKQYATCATKKIYSLMTVIVIIVKLTACRVIPRLQQYIKNTGYAEGYVEDISYTCDQRYY